MKFQIYLISLFFLISPAHAEELSLPKIEYPSLPKTGQNIQAFIPEEWLIENISLGDLNNDGGEDVVLLLRNISPNNIIKYGADKEFTFVNNPRIVAILFKEKDGYQLALQNNDIVYLSDDTDIDDPINGVTGGWVEIVNNNLSIALGYFGGIMGRNTYTFRYQNQKFELIGYDTMSTQRASGDTRYESYNLLTGKCSVSLSNVGSDIEKKAWGKIPIKPLLNIDQTSDIIASLNLHCPTKYDNEDNIENTSN